MCIFLLLFSLTVDLIEHHVWKKWRFETLKNICFSKFIVALWTSNCIVLLCIWFCNFFTLNKARVVHVYTREMTGETWNSCLWCCMLKDSLLSFHTDFSFFSQRVPLFIKHYRCFTFSFLFSYVNIDIFESKERKWCILTLPGSLFELQRVH